MLKPKLKVIARDNGLEIISWAIVNKGVIICDKILDKYWLQSTYTESRGNRSVIEPYTDYLLVIDSNSEVSLIERYPIASADSKVRINSATREMSIVQFGYNSDEIEEINILPVFTFEHSIGLEWDSGYTTVGSITCEEDILSGLVTFIGKNNRVYRMAESAGGNLYLQLIRYVDSTADLTIRCNDLLTSDYVLLEQYNDTNQYEYLL